eukprot:3516092-Pyramimonas_sp.AAC.1
MGEVNDVTLGGGYIQFARHGSPPFEEQQPRGMPENGWTFNWGLCIIVSITILILSVSTFIAAGGIPWSGIGKDWGSAPGSIFDTSDRK